MTASTFATTIANEFITALESGNAQAWRKPWAEVFTTGGLNVSAITGKPYAGANQFMLMLVKAASGFTSNQWLTKKQADEHFLVLKEDQQPCIITKFFRGTKDTEMVSDTGESETSKVSMAGYVAYKVYNLDQFKNKLSKFTKKEAAQTEMLRAYTKNELADTIIANSQIKITHGAKSAYCTRTNEVFVPNRNTFNSCEHYYATVFHEMIHATGAKFNRVFGEKFGDEKYAKEELVAEIGAAMLMGMCGIDYPHMMENHVAYVSYWIKNIKQKNTEIIKAANAAYQAFEYLTGYSESIQ
jgi:antirestriction protein ArdC